MAAAVSRDGRVIEGVAGRRSSASARMLDGDVTEAAQLPATALSDAGRLQAGAAGPAGQARRDGPASSLRGGMPASHAGRRSEQRSSLRLAQPTPAARVSSRRGCWDGHAARALSVLRDRDRPHPSAPTDPARLPGRGRLAVRPAIVAARRRDVTPAADAALTRRRAVGRAGRPTSHHRDRRAPLGWPAPTHEASRSRDSTDRASHLDRRRGNSTLNRRRARRTRSCDVGSGRPAARGPRARRRPRAPGRRRRTRSRPPGGGRGRGRRPACRVRIASRTCSSRCWRWAM